MIRNVTVLSAAGMLLIGIGHVSAAQYKTDPQYTPKDWSGLLTHVYRDDPTPPSYTPPQTYTPPPQTYTPPPSYNRGNVGRFDPP